MTDTAGDAVPEFPINEKLLEDATRAKEEWRIVRDRLAKIEEHKDQVSEAVHRRVRKDYEARLIETKEALLEKKTEIDRELATLYETRKKISLQLDSHHQKLEEIKFRNTLGEYTEEQYQNVAREEQDKISRFETVLAALESNISRYESIFEGEEELFAAETATAPPEAVAEMAEVSGVGPVPQEAEPVTDAAGYVIEEQGPDYFSAVAEGEEVTKPKVERKPKAPKEPRARLVIISGKNAGAAFFIKTTLSLGRAESNAVPLKDAKVSRQHAQIQKQGEEYVLVDLNSANGTYVNGERIEEHVLSNGDEVQIGDTILQFQEQ